MRACRKHKNCVNDAVRKAETICRDEGLRLTALRRRVLEMVWANHGSAKAYDILDKLRAEGIAAAPPTVYRALDFLLANGLVHKLHSINAYVGCSHPREHQQCYFLICDKCGEVREYCNGALARAVAGTSSRNGFKPRDVTVEISGECERCETY